jgi:hypothetical protein
LRGRINLIYILLVLIFIVDDNKSLDLVESRIERLEKLVGNFDKHDESQVSFQVEIVLIHFWLILIINKIKGF